MPLVFLFTTEGSTTAASVLLWQTGGTMFVLSQTALVKVLCTQLYYSCWTVRFIPFFFFFAMQGNSSGNAGQAGWREASGVQTERSWISHQIVLHW